MRTTLHRAWSSIREPRAITLVQTLIYALCAAGGLSTILWPPVSVQGQYGVIITAAWGWFALVGGTLGMVSCPRGVWLIEKPALILCGLALFLYAGFIISLQITETGNRLSQFFFVTIVLFHFIARYMRIHRYAYDPEK